MKSDQNRFRKVKRAMGLVNGATVSIDQAIDAVSQIEGTIFEMKLKEVDDRIVWRVKMVRAGERVKVDVDAQSGHIVEAKADVAMIEPKLVSGAYLGDLLQVAPDSSHQGLHQQSSSQGF